jgi:predicted nucleic acid-binding protein
MKSRFPSIELHGVPLVMDASGLINVLGTGMAGPLLRNLGLPVLVAARVLGEVSRHPIPGEPIAPAIAALRSEGLIQEVQLGDHGRATFLELVANDVNGGLDDGEASTIAAALEHSEQAVIVVDEKKATRIVSERWPRRRCVNTVTVLAQTRVRNGLHDGAFADVVFSALKHSRMRVPPDGMDWVVRLIGEERARQCSSLGSRW